MRQIKAGTLLTNDEWRNICDRHGETLTRNVKLEAALKHIRRICVESGHMDDEYLNNIMLIHDIARDALEVTND